VALRVTQALFLKREGKVNSVLLSSSYLPTIISLLMKRYRTAGVCSGFQNESTRCTGCTTFVPATNTECGTPQSGPDTGFLLKKHEVYRVYQYFSVSFSVRPWTVVIESVFDSLNNRYKWYKVQESQLTQGSPVYHLFFVRGTPLPTFLSKSIA